jgi:oligoribonuclease NrnB/cAMP/cGMP phosphodiesterase (DHH superfamily)
MDIILSHAACPDGFVAALIAKRRYPEAKAIFLNHGADHIEALKECAGKDVLMLDFSLGTREENDALAASTKSFRILDHHRTAEAVLKDAPYAIFDMKRSGAGLAWDYLFGEDAEDLMYRDGSNFQEPRPWWVNYTEARDLWRWDSLPNSREICAYLGTLEFTKEAWDGLDKLGNEEIDSIEVAERFGKGALAHINHYVREVVKQAQTGFLRIQTGEQESEDGSIVLPISTDYRIAVLNVPYLNCSEVGNELAKTHDISLTWFERGDGIIQFSLRSIGDIDVSVIAKSFGGGGHKNASGFQLSVEEGRRAIDGILNRPSLSILDV